LKRKLTRELAKLAKQKKQRRLADRNDIQALSRIFSATAFVPPRSLEDSPQQNLINLAESYQSHAIASDSYGNQVQLVNSVWAVRSFMNSADLYYVLQEADYHNVVKVVVQGFGFPYLLASLNNSVESLLAGSPTVIQTSPQTTMEATQETSGVSENIGGSAGWNETQGLNALVSGGLSISNSKTTIIPPITITNNANLVTGQTMWNYDVNDFQANPETITLFNQWIWSVPFSAYTLGQQNIQFNCQSNLKERFVPFTGQGPQIHVNLPVNLGSVVPLPFSQTFALQQPVVTGVSPSSVSPGDEFTIVGTGFYPSLVQAVIIGGTQVNAANVTTVSDTQINVIAPDTDECLLGCTVVVQTTQGTSNTNFTITID
jgi:hypothetical protein